MALLKKPYPRGVKNLNQEVKFYRQLATSAREIRNYTNNQICTHPYPKSEPESEIEQKDEPPPKKSKLLALIFS